MIADNSYYDFYISSSTTNDETQQNLNSVQIKAEHSITFKQHFCNLRETDVISPFTSLNKVIEFFKIGTSGKNKDYKCTICHNAIDDVLKVNIIYKQELFEIDKTFEFYPEEHDDNEMLKKRIAKLEKEVKHLKTMNMCEFEGLIVETRESIMSCVREIEIRINGCVNEQIREDVDMCYQQKCIFNKPNLITSDVKTVNNDDMKYYRLDFCNGSGSYLSVLNGYDLLLRNIIQEFATFHANYRFMNIYGTYLNLYNDELIISDNTSLPYTISRHHVMQKMYKMMYGGYNYLTFSQCTQDSADKIRKNEHYRQIVKHLFDFMKTLHAHYTALNA